MKQTTIIIKPNLLGRLIILKQLLFNKTITLKDCTKTWGKFNKKYEK